MTNLKVGSTVWVFDVNRRVYPPREGVNTCGNAPIYREHFRPMPITGETRVSWVLRDGRKVSKRTLDGICTTTAQIDAACWVHDHVHAISRAVERCEDATILREIASLVGYKA